LRNLHPSTAIIARPEDLEIGGPEPFKRTGEAVLLLEGDDPIDIEIVEAVLKKAQHLISMPGRPHVRPTSGFGTTPTSGDVRYRSAVRA
jgi:hypothetical protein